MTSSESGWTRRWAGRLLVEHRGKLDVGAAGILAALFLLVSGRKNFDATMSQGLRSSLYGSLAGTSGALLGFTLAALAILVALPSTDRLNALREHPRWSAVQGAYFRAGWALLVALVSCTVGIAVDAGSHPCRAYETVTVAVLGCALIRVAASLVALDQVLIVAGNRTPRRPHIDDPGP